MSVIKKITCFTKNKSRFLLAFLALLAIPFFSGCGAQSTAYMVNLEIWGVFDDSLVFNEIISQYKNLNPYVGEIKYRKFSQDTYVQELLDALASGQGPDIYLVNNSWLPSYVNKLEPAPNPFVSEQDLKNNFPDTVLNDFADNGKVYAVPLSVDSMALYYNKDMFNAAGITSAPKTWIEFNEDIKKLTVVDSFGNIQQAGAAIGTASNINRASDLLSLLMFQNGVEFPMKKGQLAKFDEGVVSQNGNVVQAGELSLGYYTQFARLSTSASTQNPLYTWNSRQHDSIDAFAEGSVAMMFNYSWQNSIIKSKNPKLNYGIAMVPQFNQANPVSVSNYWGFGVSKYKNATPSVGDQTAAPVPNEVRTHEAWQFLRFLTLKNTGTVTLYNAYTKKSKDFPVNFDPALDYLKRTKQPAARRDLIELQKTDANLGAFAQSNLIAKHWYQQDPTNIDNIFANMIESVVRGDISVHDGLTLTKNKVNYSSGGSSAR